MTLLILPKRTQLSEAQIEARRHGMEHLLYASKDINDWSFSICSAPPDKGYLAHMFVGKCRRSGIEQPFNIAPDQADANGNYEKEHARIIEAFAGSLLYLAQLVKESREAGRLILPGDAFNIDMAVKDALHRGDHPNSFAG